MNNILTCISHLLVIICVTNTSSTQKSNNENAKHPSIRENSILRFLKENFVVAEFLYDTNTPNERMKTFYPQVLDIDEHSDPIRLKLKYLKQLVG